MNHQLHRALALGLLLLLMLIFVVTLVTITQLKTEAKQQYADVKLEFDSHEAMIAESKEMMTINKALFEKNSNDKRYLSTDNISLTVANFQKKIQRLVRRAGAKVSSIQVSKQTPSAGFTPISIQLEFVVTHKGLTNVIYQLENNTPIGFINNMRLQKAPTVSRHLNLNKTLLNVRLSYTTYVINLTKT